MTRLDIKINNNENFSVNPILNFLPAATESTEFFYTSLISH